MYFLQTIFMWPWPLILYLYMNIGLSDNLEIYFTQNSKSKELVWRRKEIPLLFHEELDSINKIKYIEISKYSII